MTESITIEAKNEKHQSDILEYFRDIGECFPEFKMWYECSLYSKDHPYTPKDMDSCHAVYISFSISAPYELVRLLHNSAKYVSKENNTRLYYDDELIDCNNESVYWKIMFKSNIAGIIKFFIFYRTMKKMRVYFNNYNYLLLDNKE